VAILKRLHIRQFNKYYEEVRRVAAMTTGSQRIKLGNAVKCKPRLLVCAPSNAAVDNIILKIMEDGFVDGSGKRYNPSIIHVEVGKSDAVRDVALEKQVDDILQELSDLARLETTIASYKMELQ
jgi:senataxin